MAKINFLKAYNAYESRLTEEFGGNDSKLFKTSIEEYETYLNEYGYSIDEIDEKDVDTILLKLNSNCHRLIEKLNNNFGNVFLYNKLMRTYGLATMFLMISKNIDSYKI